MHAYARARISRANVIIIIFITVIYLNYSSFFSRYIRRRMNASFFGDPISLFVSLNLLKKNILLM